MTTFDFSPLYRSSVGFDRFASLLDTALSGNHTQTTYPPYNIERFGEDRYGITMAVAGFEFKDLSIEFHNSKLTIKGAKTDSEEERDFLHQGIAERAFEHRFQLADYVKVSGARLENGLLNIELVRELPEEMKPREIAIETGSSGKLIEGEKEGIAA